MPYFSLFRVFKKEHDNKLHSLTLELRSLQDALSVSRSQQDSLRSQLDKAQATISQLEEALYQQQQTETRLRDEFAAELAPRTEAEAALQKQCERLKSEAHTHTSKLSHLQMLNEEYARYAQAFDKVAMECTRGFG